MIKTAQPKANDIVAVVPNARNQNSGETTEPQERVPECQIADPVRDLNVEAASVIIGVLDSITLILLMN